MATGDVNKLREVLDEVLGELSERGDFYLAEKIEKALTLTRRSKYKPVVSRPKRGSLTPELRASICAYVKEHPSMSNREIGSLFGVDGGRVSEALGSKPE